MQMDRLDINWAVGHSEVCLAAAVFLIGYVDLGCGSDRPFTLIPIVHSLPIGSHLTTGLVH